MRSGQHGGDDALTNMAVADVGAYFANGAGALVSDDVWCRGHHAAGPVERVAAFYAYGFDLDEHAGWIYDGVGDVLVPNHVRRASLVVDGCLHGPHSRGPGEEIGERVTLDSHGGGRDRLLHRNGSAHGMANGGSGVDA